MKNVIIGTSSFRLRLDEEFRNNDKLMNRIDLLMDINKDLAHKLIEKCIEQNLYILFYRAIVIFLTSLFIFMIPFLFNLNVLFFSGISILFIIWSLYNFIKFSNLKNSLKMTINMTYNMYIIHNQYKNKTPE